MSKTITLTVADPETGCPKPREIEVDYLTPGALEYYQAWIAYEARVNYNPLAELAGKITVLPRELQAIAMREFIAGLDLDKVPKLMLLNAAQSLRGVQTLCILSAGENFVTAENHQQAFRALTSFIQSKEIEVNSFEEANRLRAALGKPPIGQPAASEASVDSTADQPPQGG